MKTNGTRLVALVLVSIFWAGRWLHGQEPALSDEQLKFFEAKIRPVLVTKCYSCHSAESKSIAGSLLLDSRDGLLNGGDSGPAIEPGSPDDSLLIELIRYHDKDLGMPPQDAGGKLPTSVIKDFETWVAMGAPDPRTASTIPIDPGAGDQARTWWAFQPLQRPQLPAVENTEWARSELDLFLLNKLESAGLPPSTDAEPEPLLRRVYFDLIGLPPAPEQAQAFAESWRLAQSETERDELFAEVVDALLNSSQFGERWARHWLDVARYAESSGKDVNVLYPYAWRYRDYVIDAFNADMPYDQFVREQLAGDLMASDSDAERSRQLVATGFLAIGPRSLNEQNPRQFLLDQADEQIDTFSQAFLGMTLACARCHDHKFDPVSQREYTALAGIFLSTDTHYGTSGAVGGRNAGDLLALPDGSITSLTRRISQRQLESKRQQLQDLEASRNELIRERRNSRGADSNGTLNLLRINNQITQLRIELDQYDESGSAIPQAVGVTDKPAQAPRSNRFARQRFRPQRNSGFVSVGDSPLFIRGETDRPSETISRGVPGLLPFLHTPEIPENASGRLQLADWICDVDNPLTSRVIVNRVWYWLFGTGLVTSLDNFGTTGATPVHAELLDFLATRFVDNGWRIKALIRTMVTSRAYRMASTFNETAFQRDPENSLWWRVPPRRLEAEALRDAMLSLSGQLDLNRPRGSMIGRAGDGPLGANRRFGISETTVANYTDSYRSIYLPVARSVESLVLGPFDVPEGVAVQTARETTNVPGQALFMMNSPYVADLSNEIARRVLRADENRRRAAPQVESTYDRLSWMIFGRASTSTEQRAVKRLVNQFGDDYLAGWTSVVRAMLTSAEFRSLE